MRTNRLRPLYRSAMAGVAAVLSACGAGVPTSVDPESATPALEVFVDTLDMEVQNLWVRISAVPNARQNVVLTWELAAETANPFWRPQSMRKAGRRSFERPDTARVWGNVPRAYDFRLVASGATASGDFVADTLEVQAPACRDASRPDLLCNPSSHRITRDRRGPG